MNGKRFLSTKLGDGMEFNTVIKKRRSIRKYKTEKIPDEILENILEAARQSPSGKNIQPYHFIIVKNQETKHKIDPRLTDAPVYIVGFVDPTKGRCSVPDGIIAFEHIILAAVNYGLGACWKGTYLGELEQEEKEIKEILNVPMHMSLVAYTPLGYSDEQPDERPKKPLSEIVHYEKW